MHETKKHIAIICSRLDLPGGTEKAVTGLANLFQKNGHRVNLVILDETDQMFHPVNPHVSVSHLPLFFGIGQKGNVFSRKLDLMRDFYSLEAHLKKISPDVVIATEYPFAAASAMTYRKKAIIISWEHHHYDWLKKSWFWKKLSNEAYKRMDYIVCLNETEALHFKQFTEVKVIPNFLDNNNENRSSLESKSILTIAWLIPRKGIDLLLEVAKKVLSQFPTWKWKLIGKGEMQSVVEQFIKLHKLEGRLILQAPVSSNIDEDYLSASLFVLTSRLEAFPMVLLEAFSFGIPCIAFDCPSGPADIIQNHNNGFLIKLEDVDAMSSRIIELILDDNKRKAMGLQAYASSRKYTGEKIYEMWDKVWS